MGDKRNTKGGKWVVAHPHKLAKEWLDQKWLWTVLACIGEAFGEEGICGCVVSVRKSQDRMGLWTGDANDAEATRRIGRLFKQTVELPENYKLGYQSHQDSMRGDTSFNNKNR